MCNSAWFGSRRGFQCSQRSRTCFGIFFNFQWKAEKLVDNMTEGVKLNDHSLVPLCHSLCAHSLNEIFIQSFILQYNDETIRIFGSQTYRPDWIFQWPIGIKFWFEMYHRKWSVRRVKGVKSPAVRVWDSVWLWWINSFCVNLISSFHVTVESH